jgi:hypothetical protein
MLIAELDEQRRNEIFTPAKTMQQPKNMLIDLSNYMNPESAAACAELP